VCLKFVELLLNTDVYRVSCVLDDAAMSGRPKASLVWTETEREKLEALTLQRRP